MGLFDRFRKKRTPEPPPGPETERDTMALLLFRDTVDPEDAASAVRRVFGRDAVRAIDRGVPRAPALTLELEGTVFFCSCMPMPHPAEVCDLSKIEEGLFSPEERTEILAYRSFLVLAQQGGGGTLADKRRICRLFTRLAGALMELDGALGVYVNGAELLIGRRAYLTHAAVLARNADDPAYFPAPLWVGIRHGQKGEHALTGTWGLHQFGFLELWFLDAVSAWPELHEKLYLMSIFQITGKELYRDGDTIAFTEGEPTRCRELNGALFLMGGGV